MRIKKKYRLLVQPMPNSLNKHPKNFIAVSEESNEGSKIPLRMVKFTLIFTSFM